MSKPDEKGCAPPDRAQRYEAGQRAYLSGDSAERSVAAEYFKRGCTVLETRWRGHGGEIDLIIRDGPVYVFCEVKKARNFDVAMTRLRPAQMRRIHAAAEEFLGTTKSGSLSEVRFDLAIMDGQGRIEILENAFGHF